MKGPAKRLVIERIELDVRNIAPGTAQSLARALGPALARALAHRDLRAEPAERIDAGRIDGAAANGMQAADAIAQRIAHHLSAKDT